ncbi:hypothetical protein FEM03_15505 [Phragmitibacter flavus]|uniref:Uncharacterized protein n=1 Tax=Phragmitibacter flavus TaxID=2576071 RepID=A0A5R8KBP9_9BACT|nr:hypothetical protein [Phragmitibacter flavus]TLD69732.1 hypothetical protein FEM03_15505 [Phragmitibacter flavus]
MEISRWTLVVGVACLALLLTGSCVSHVSHEKWSSNSSLIQLKDGKLGINFVGAPGGNKTSAPFKLQFTLTARPEAYSQVFIRSLKVTFAPNRTIETKDLTILIGKSGFGQSLTEPIVSELFQTNSDLTISFNAIVVGKSSAEKSRVKMKFVKKVESGVVIFNPLTDFT